MPTADPALDAREIRPGGRPDPARRGGRLAVRLRRRYTTGANDQLLPNRSTAAPPFSFPGGGSVETYEFLSHRQTPTLLFLPELLGLPAGPSS